MRKRCIGGILVLMMAVSLCACSSSSSDSSKKETATEAVATEAKAEEATSAGGTDDAVLQEVKSKNLPVGYIADGGYYNSYFGFKVILAEEKDELNTSKDMLKTFISGMNDVSTDTDKPLEEVLTDALENNKHALVYTTVDGSVTVDGEKISLEINVGKNEQGQTSEQILEEVKENCRNSYFVQSSDLTQNKVEIAGKQRDCFSWTKEKGETVSRAKIICFEGDYACTISLSGMSSLDKACSIFEKF